MLLGADEGWSIETFGATTSAVFERTTATHRDAIAAALDSVLLGRATDRASYRKGLELIDDPAKREA